MNLHFVFAIIALLCFAASAAGASFGRLNLTALGLVFLTLVLLFM